MQGFVINDQHIIYTRQVQMSDFDNFILNDELGRAFFAKFELSKNELFFTRTKVKAKPFSLVVIIIQHH
jgi:hypothetical protein